MTVKQSMLIAQLLSAHNQRIKSLQNNPDLRTGTDQDRRDVREELEQQIKARNLVSDIRNSADQETKMQTAQARAKIAAHRITLIAQYLDQFGSYFPIISKQLR